MDNGGKEDQPNAVIRWSASDSIDHERGVVWYIAAFLVSAGIIALTVWVKLWTAGILALVIFITVLVVTRKPSREIEYSLSNDGLTMEGKLHRFDEFRAFGVRHDSALWQLVLIPVTRFGMSTVVFIHEDQGEQIVDIFGARLPMEEVKTDLVDKLVQKLKL